MAKPEKTVLIGSFSFDIEVEVLESNDGEQVPLRPQTARVLGILAANPRQLVTKDALMSTVWADTHVTDDSLVQCISEIRRALGAEEAKLLVTVPRKGYRLDASAGSTKEEDVVPARINPPSTRPRRGTLAAVAVMVVLFAAIAFTFLSRNLLEKTPVTVAVLPLLTLSGDEDQDYLSVGLAEDLLTDLSRSAELKVLSRSTTFGYRKVDDPAARVHSELGATHLVDGSLQRDGERLRISVQLVDTATGVSIWAQRFDQEVEGLFDLQDEVRKRVLNALSIEFDLDTETKASSRTRDVTAYDLLLRGRFLEASLTRSGIASAIELYERAIDVDPTYGDAHARLANMYDFSSRFGWGDSVEGDRALALEFASRAVRLDPDNPFAHWTLGRVLSRLDGSESNADRALKALERAIALDANYADAYAFIALLFVGAGATEDAQKAIDTAFNLNLEPPSWYIRNRGIIRYFEGAFEAAVADFTKASELNPTAHFSRVWLAAALAKAGQIDDAEWELEEGLALGAPDNIKAILDSNEIIRDPSFRNLYAEGLRAAGVPG